MMTLRQLSAGVASVPYMPASYLADLGEHRGRQELFTKQAPQKLKALREHAIIESAVSSNRIEGVEIDPSRVAAVVLGKARLRDRPEEEVRGYRKALDLIHKEGGRLPVEPETVLRLHRLCRGDIWDAGKFKEKTEPIVEKYADGRQRVRFMPIDAARTPTALTETLSLWREAVRDRVVHPLILTAAANLDFLCVHPFRDGNGRVSRLLLLLQCYHLGYEVGRYVSLERVIEENKDRYYETLEQSSQGWHEGKHDPWPFIGYALYVLKTAYAEFERRAGEVRSPCGEKTALILQAIGHQEGTFRVADLQKACPGVSIDLIRRVLKDSRPGVECLGRGRNALWHRTKRWKLGSAERIG